MENQASTPPPGGPVATPLPAVPSADFWSRSQWDVYVSFMEAVYPPMTTAKATTVPHSQIAIAESSQQGVHDVLRATLKGNAPSRDDVDAFLAHNPARTRAFLDGLVRTSARFPQRQKRSLGVILYLLSTRIGNFIFTGHFQPFQDLPVDTREGILRAWHQSSWCTPLRVIAKTLATIAKWVTVRTDPLFLRLSGYPDTFPSYQPAPGFPYSFLQPPPPSESTPDAPHVITADVVIVGSGCGGAVCAKILAEAGYSVIVVDKAYSFSPSHFPMSQEQGTHHLFDNSGFVSSDDLSINLVAGSSWGGGGTVNWGVSLPTQEFVRREWAKKDKLPLFTSAEYQDCLDRVCEFMGVSDQGVRHNHRNRTLLDGCKRLGWEARTTPVNSAGRDHYCGQCHFGCATAGKRGPTVTWLPAAAEAGAQFMEGFEVERVLFQDQDDSSGNSGDKVARGVLGTWTLRDSSPAEERVTRRVEIQAKKVILSSGTLWSPVLLLKSGIKNPLVGSNLHLHPCNFVVGCYDEDTKPWEGGNITSCCDAFENLDQAGHGVKLEPSGMVPYSVLNFFPWRGGLENKSDMLRYRSMAAFIALTRDRDPGSVFADPRSGRPRVVYTPSDFDRAHTLEGVVALAKVCYVTGAREIRVLHPDVEPFIRNEEHVESSSGDDDEDKNTNPPNPDPNPTTPTTLNDPALTDTSFATWLASVRTTLAKTPPTVGVWASAHQMGTCRMTGLGPHAGVVDPAGRVWGAANLYVADASVLPSASGVNPMVTVMAVADWVARGVVGELKGEGR